MCFLFLYLCLVAFTQIQKKVIREAKIKEGEHSDTSFSAGSLKAARRAAGAVQHAVDRVLVGRNRNAFCVVRPPGHHAGVNGLLAGGESCGFCIFNSVAAGAMHALSDESHRPRCERVAIVDIDAHHGNGTEEIIKKCHDPGRLFFFSVHIFDNDKKKSATPSAPAYKFYPGTGDEDDVANNIINVPIAPMWKEKEVAGKLTTPKATNAEPIRTRGRSKRSASSESGEKPSPASADKSITSDTDSVSVDEPSTNGGAVLSTNGTATSEPDRPAHYLLGTGRMAYRRAVQQRLLPSLRAFNPDLILLSSGFDATRGDVGNARHFIGRTQQMGIDLEPEDYAWTTRRVSHYLVCLFVRRTKRFPHLSHSSNTSTFPFWLISHRRFSKLPTFAAKGELFRSWRVDMAEPRDSNLKPQQQLLQPPPITPTATASCPSWTNRSLQKVPSGTSRR